ncbi:hypothetical protein OTBS_0120 [Orientia tsutsugamushi str. Boryong]|uniref:Uncharacterized protein n=1 Tax=Orientia tsutsugamushi (strain Boryong) TaxID=357244 RepID=A5CC29_ORITB|nr:hypothetical protein OTBS_0120 [Orientia tsutsugamushi str. Boryong]
MIMNSIIVGIDVSKEIFDRDQIKTKTESFTSISIFIGNNFELRVNLVIQKQIKQTVY